MEATINYGLKKPAYEDGADIAVLNQNADKVDAELKKVSGGTITTLSCTKTGTVYALTGLSATTGRVPLMFAAPSAYAAGDTVTIDGTAYTLKTTDGSALTTGAWAAGAVITGTADVDNKVLHVEPGIPDSLPNPAALTLAHGYNGNTGSYNGSTAKTVTTPYVTFHTSAPGTVAVGEIWAVY